MDNEIQLLRNNDNRDWSDLEWINEFYEFLQGTLPDGMAIKPKVKLTQRQAFNIIWFLQEHLSLLPDHIERCDNCGRLYNSHSEGHHSDLNGKFYCSESCEPYDLYEREQKAERKLKKKLATN